MLIPKFETYVPPQILDALNFMIKINLPTDNWVEIKKNMINILNPEFRRYFSDAVPWYELQWFNDMEDHLLDLYEKETGVRLMIKDRERCPRN